MTAAQPAGELVAEFNDADVVPPPDGRSEDNNGDHEAGHEQPAALAAGLGANHRNCVYVEPNDQIWSSGST